MLACFVLGSNPLGGNILCSPSPSEETINRGSNTPIPITHALICEELKDCGIPPKTPKYQRTFGKGKEWIVDWI